MSPEEALTAVTLYALENDRFREVWDGAVLAMADKFAAEITGGYMAGRTSGYLESGEFEFAVPDGMDPWDALLAFRLQVNGEVSRRLRDLTRNPPGGLG